jgi:hypothetical protein
MAELFTFNNHDSRGGCPRFREGETVPVYTGILLNVENPALVSLWLIRRNGTVKFIRTEEELQQLRWK